MSLTLDELAAASKVPSRTIRYYQAQGVLPPPERKGRASVYSGTHLSRLELISGLKQRGLQLKAIGEVLARVDRGEQTVSDWLGLDAQLDESWASDEPRVVDARALASLAGRLTPTREHELLVLGLVERKGTQFLLPRPELLSLALKMEAMGVDLGLVVAAARLLRRRFSRVAEELASQFLPGRRREGLPPTTVMREVRPVALDAARLIFAQEMERVLQRWARETRRG